MRIKEKKASKGPKLRLSKKASKLFESQKRTSRESREKRSSKFEVKFKDKIDLGRSARRSDKKEASSKRSSLKRRDSFSQRSEPSKSFSRRRFEVSNLRNSKREAPQSRVRSTSSKSNTESRERSPKLLQSEVRQRNSSNRNGRVFGSRGGSRKQSSQSNGGRRFKGKFIDERLFINKADKETEITTYEPKNTFKDFNVSPKLQANLDKIGYVKPSPIQDESIPVALTGKDVIGIASTGTGKTAAFLIPLINKLEKDRNQKIMILTPTRELALQVQKEFINFTDNMKLFSVTCVGGSPIFPQIRQLSLGVHVVVGTPGRVKDLIARGKIKMSNYTSVVLDEADRMLDMGFIDDIREILNAMPKEKQGLFFSATFDSKIKELCNDFLNNPKLISLKTRDTSSSVDQNIVRVDRKENKIDHLHKILNESDSKRVLIFREMKRSVDELTSELSSRGIKVLGLHGDMRNRERERAVKALKDGQIQALIATDVAARGIHIDDISHVINYDIPNDYETYIHRIGRTGRGNSKGIALTFVSK